MGNNSPNIALEAALAKRAESLRTALSPWNSGLGLLPLLALLTIACRPGLSVNELAETLGVPQQSASRAVAILSGRYAASDTDTNDEFIYQGINASEPRRRALYLSLQGADAIRRLCD